jgi:hypothetical protein
LSQLWISAYEWCATSAFATNTSQGLADHGRAVVTRAKFETPAP